MVEVAYDNEEEKALWKKYDDICNAEETPENNNIDKARALLDILLDDIEMDLGDNAACIVRNAHELLL